MLIGCCCVAASYVFFKQTGNIYANPSLDRIITFLFVIGLFMQIRRYRESEELKGYISLRESSSDRYVPGPLTQVFSMALMLSSSTRNIRTRWRIT